jgi:hypothetical protein
MKKDTEPQLLRRVHLVLTRLCGVETLCLSRSDKVVALAEATRLAHIEKQFGGVIAARAWDIADAMLNRGDTPGRVKSDEPCVTLEIEGRGSVRVRMCPYDAPAADLGRVRVFEFRSRHASVQLFPLLFCDRSVFPAASALHGLALVIERSAPWIAASLVRQREGQGR